MLRDVPGIVTAAELGATVDAIASIQLTDGNIPWFPGGHTDPWNLVEAAMALDVGGRHEEARAAYEWLAGMQRADGSWHAYYLGNDVEDPTLDTNVTCYIATGAWHHYLSTDDAAYLRHQWPVVEAAIDYALGHQRETGEIAWRGDDPADGALLTGSSSIHLSLKCAIAIAERLDHERPDWELSLGALCVAIAHRPDRFLDKDRWAMDWYYPILGGVLRGHPAQARVVSGWPKFVVESRGVRCVSDRPWITAAETCEFVMALDAIGNDEHARMLFESVQFLRSETGGYWTGANFDDDQFQLEGEHYPEEQPTWNSAAVVLAADALCGEGPRAGLFRGERLPEGLTAVELLAAGVEIERERELRSADRIAQRPVRRE
ncbi:MAG: prenyltransferase/squalene oxidase repeat-containing protein [Acidimicrobiia bacterium]